MTHRLDVSATLTAKAGGAAELPICRPAARLSSVMPAEPQPISPAALVEKLIHADNDRRVHRHRFQSAGAASAPPADDAPRSRGAASNWLPFGEQTRPTRIRQPRRVESPAESTMSSTAREIVSPWPI